jgi:septum formation topological specificity factor MinE
MIVEDLGGIEMRRVLIAALSLGVLLGLAGSLSLSSRAETASIRGEYVEVRTASVFAGACHYNGELTTAGRDALMAWNVKSGQWRGVDLAGVRAVAVVSAETNLAEESERRAEIIVAADASDAQSLAIVEALKSRYMATFGKIVAVRRGELRFDHEGKTYKVNAGDSVSLNVEAMPDDLCCKMPQLVWYSPLVPLESRKVGYTTSALYSGSEISDRWQRSGENSAFYGSFAL